MDFLDVVREQVGLLSHGSLVDRVVCPQGAAVMQERAPIYYHNCFYPFESEFRYSRDVLRRLESFYRSKNLDGCVFDCFGEFPGRSFARMAAVLVPETATVTVEDHDFTCVRTFDLDRWSDTYASAAGPSVDRLALRERTGRLENARETRRYLFGHCDEVIGAGALVRVTDDTYMVSGFAIRKEFRGGILARVRAVRMATDSNVVALTDTRFARVLVRALGGARILGTGEFVRISSLEEFLTDQSVLVEVV